MEDNVHALRKPVACPWCGHVLTAFGDVFSQPRKPSAGDPAMCIECGKFSFIVGASSGLRKATYEEFQELMHEPTMVLAWLSWKRMKMAERDNNRG